MTITLQTLDGWMESPTECETLEFKEAKSQFDTQKVLRYCVALANEGGGHLILGVSDKPPRRVVGSQAFSLPNQVNKLKATIVDRLHFRVEISELNHPDGRVLVIAIPSRPTGTPMSFEGTYLMRAGEDLVPMTPDQLKRIFAEGQPDWLMEAAVTNASADEVVALLDTQGFFDLLKLPYPSARGGVIEKLISKGLIVASKEGLNITNMAALLLAKRLNSFHSSLARKAPRVVIYEGQNKIKTRSEQIGGKGYAVGFEALVEYVHSAAPQNHFIEVAIREEVKMFPKQAVRELIANALVHQDFTATGASVMIEMYADRLEISNPGIPPIDLQRFIDEHRSRNERFADLMRLMGLCEEKGSGVDKVVDAAEVFQLPAPDFRMGQQSTVAVLFAHKEFADMVRADRVRACYQHCCLQYVSNQKMSNQSLRERFRLGETKTAVVSQVIGQTKEEGLIKADDAESTSTRYARYVPYWA